MQLTKERIKSLKTLLDLDREVSARLNNRLCDARLISSFETAYRFALLGALGSLFDALGDNNIFSNINSRRIRDIIFHFPHIFEQFSAYQVFALAFFMYDKLNDEIPELFFVNTMHYLHLLEDGKSILDRIATIKKTEETDDFLKEQMEFWNNKLSSIVNEIQTSNSLLEIFTDVSGTFKDQYICEFQGNVSAFYYAIQSGFATTLQRSDNPKSSELAKKYLSRLALKNRLAKNYRHNDNGALIFSYSHSLKLHLYVMYERVDNAKIAEFISNDCCIDFCNLRGESTILLLARKGEWNIVLIWLNEYKTDLDINHYDSNGMNLLLTAACQNKAEVIKDLMARYVNLDTNCEMITGHNILLFALHAKDMDLFEWYVSQGKVNSQIITSTLRTLLQGGSGALEHDKCIKAIRFLAKNGAIHRSDSSEEVPPILYIGFSSGFKLNDRLWIKLLKLFIKHGADINSVRGIGQYKRSTTFAAMDKPKVLTWILDQKQCDRSIGGVHNYTMFEIDKYLQFCPFDDKAKNAREIIKNKIGL